MSRPGSPTLEFDGVALGAIQDLNQKLEEQRAELKRKDTGLRPLEERLQKLEALEGRGVPAEPRR